MTKLIWPSQAQILQLRTTPYDRKQGEAFLSFWARHLNAPQVRTKRNPASYLITQGVGHFFDHLDRLPGSSIGNKWPSFESWWMENVKGKGCLAPHLRTALFQTAVVMRLVAPSLRFQMAYKPGNWIRTLLPPEAPIRMVLHDLEIALGNLPDRGFSPRNRVDALHLATGLLLANDYWRLDEITDEDLTDLKAKAAGQHTFWMGADTLDAAMCAIGVFSRMPLRGIVRKKRPQPGPDIADYVGLYRVPELFREVTLLYIQYYLERISSRHSTLRSKIQSLARFWQFIAATFPDVMSSADVRPEHAKAFIPHRLATAHASARASVSGARDGKTTANHDLAVMRTFFTDIACWSLEERSPFAAHVPPAPPLSFRDTQLPELTRAYRLKNAAVTRRIIDLEREMPKIRALAYEEWQVAQERQLSTAADMQAGRREARAFWTWAILELLVQSGLRIEEAHHLTVFDILRRTDNHRRVYFLLHVGPSKFDRARLIPIGDLLGRVLSEIIIHVKRFYGTSHVPTVDNFDFHERQPLPRAPYLLQGRTRPHMIGFSTIRDCLASLSRRAGATTYDGRPLEIAPHDCRRVFATEHLNAGTPPHVIQALLGHERLDTVMIYAKLYPTTLIENYRQHVRGIYQTIHGPEVLRAPSEEDWAQLAKSCDLRDMGTHLCALPAGEHCPKGLVCLGCVHGQPKKSARPIFTRMRTSHAQALERAEKRHEPLGQLAARRLELSRIDQAIRRADDLTTDVAAAMEAALAN
jgi:site-specific recombinase XerD